MVLTLIICFLVAVIIAFSRDALNLWLSKKVGFSLKETMTDIGIPIVTLKNGGKEFNFILDTGSDISHIDSNIKDSLSNIEEVEGDNLTVTTANGSVEGNNNWIRVPLNYKKQSFIEDFMPLDLHDSFEVLREDTGIQLHGILGNTFLRKYRYVLDYVDLVAYTK